VGKARSLAAHELTILSIANHTLWHQQCCGHWRLMVVPLALQVQPDL